MLQGFRAGSRSIITQIILVILMGMLTISFVFWGIGDVFRGFGGRTVAKIGSTEISIDQYRQSFTERLQTIGRQINRPFTPDQARALGIDRQVLAELVSDAALDEKTRKLGLSVANETIANRVRAYPNFKGPDGNFNALRYQSVLRENNYTEATFLAAEKRLALRQQLLSTLGGEIVPPAVLANAFWRLSNETRAIEFVRLTAAQAGTIATPSEADLKTYFDANKAAFRAPEYRTIRVIHLTPAFLAKDITITDEDVKKAYENLKARFTLPEKRTVEQITIASPDLAKAAAERLAKGEKLEAIAKDLKVEVVSLGAVAKNEILDPVVGEAAFTLAVNTVSAPIAGRFGTVIVRVTKIEAGRVLPFEEVSKPIRDDLALQRAIAQTQALHDKIEDERGAGSTIEEIGNKLKVPVVSITVDRSGRKTDGQPIVDLPSFEAILSGAFAAQKGAETDAIELRETRSTIWYEVTDINASRDRTLEEAKADIEKRWKEEQTGKKLTELAQEIQKKLDDGATFAAAAPNLKPEKADLKRGATVPGLDANTVARAFLTALNKSGQGVPENSNDRIVYRVVKIDLPDTAPAAQLIQQLSQSIQEDLQVQYVNRLQNELGLYVNDAAVRQVTGDSR